MERIRALKWKLLNKYFAAKSKLHYWYVCNCYHIPHTLFKWTQDEEGDICFRLFIVFHFVKYKEHTIFRFGFIDMKNAPKYIGT